MMKNKLILSVALFLTMFLITIGVGIVAKVFAKSNPRTPVSNSEIDVKAYADREQQYKQIIEQANQQIELANQQIAFLSTQTSPLPTIEPAVVETSTFAISADQSFNIAQQLTGLVPLGIPELVDFGGSAAYEVKYEQGNVYIDANSGAVLYNGLPQNISNEQALILAANYLPLSQPLSMSTSFFNGAPVYVIAFTDGQSVFVDMLGNIVAIQMAAPVESAAYTTSNSSSGSSTNASSNTSNNTSSESSSSEHETESEEDDD